MSLPPALAVFSREWIININTNQGRNSAHHDWYRTRLDGFYTWMRTIPQGQQLPNAQQFFYRVPGRRSGRTTPWERDPANWIPLELPNLPMKIIVRGGREYGPRRDRLHTHINIKVISFYMPEPDESSIRFDYDHFIYIMDNYFNKGASGKSLSHRIDSVRGAGDEYDLKDGDPFDNGTDEEEDYLDVLKRFRSIARMGGHAGVDQPDALERFQRNFKPATGPFRMGRPLQIRNRQSMDDTEPATYRRPSSSSASVSAARPLAPARIPLHPFAPPAAPKLSAPKPAGPDGAIFAKGGARIKPAASKPWPKRQ